MTLLQGQKIPVIPAQAKVILFGVETTMKSASFNFIISGYKPSESEAQNFDPEKVSAKFIDLWANFPSMRRHFLQVLEGLFAMLFLGE